MIITIITIIATIETLFTSEEWVYFGIELYNRVAQTCYWIHYTNIFNTDI